MIVSFEDLKDFSGIDTDARLSADLQIEAAQEIVENYLGYEIEQEEKTVTFSGDLEPRINLGAPIRSFTAVEIDGEDQDVSRFYSSGEYLCRTGAVFPRGERNISVTFTGGYESDSIPALMKLTVLRIAAVLFSESDGTIGVQSVSDPNTGSRTFMERTFNRYLRELGPYRVAQW